MAGQELYFRVKVGLRDSDGARILERRLGDPRAHSYVPDMWDWFVQKHPEGEVVGPDASFLVARGAGWIGDADKFCAALVAAGYLAVIPEGFRVKGWKEWAGFHFTHRATEAAKKRNQRVQTKGQAGGHPGDVPGTDGGRGAEKKASEGVCPGDPSYISSLVSSEGVQGEAKPRPRARLVSPFPAGRDPYPQTSAVLAALFDRGIDAAPPGERSAPRVEAAIVAAGVDVAVERLAVVYANPDAKRPLTFHVDAIRGLTKPHARGDLGVELRPWSSRLTPDEYREARAELAALHPDLEDAPLGCTGDPTLHPVDAIAALNERWRRVVEGRA